MAVFVRMLLMMIMRTTQMMLGATRGCMLMAVPAQSLVGIDYLRDGIIGAPAGVTHRSVPRLL
jgi:hypothetical protein